MKAFYKAGALAAITLACSLSAHAADEIYIGGAVGRGAHNLGSDYDDRDKADTGYKLYGGYRLSKSLALEVSYLDFGKATGRDGPALVKLETAAVGFGVAFFGDLSPKWSLIGRLGVANVKTEGTITVGNLELVNRKEDSAKVYAGIGAEYAITPQLRIQASWDFTQGEVDGDTGRVDLLAIGARYSF